MTDSNYNLTAVGKLLERRAKKAKMFWFNCVPSRKRLNKRQTSSASVCDGGTQTTPTIEKTFCMDANSMAEECLQLPSESCVVDSSRHSLDSNSDTYMESCDSPDNGEGVSDVPQFGNCPCIERVRNAEICRVRLDESAILEKLIDLQEEINSLRHELGSLKSASAVPLPLLPPPPPPPPPPPFPSSPIFQHSVSLQLLPQRRSTNKIQCEETSGTQDRGKPVVTLEDLQKVKLRQVTSVAGLKC